MKRWIASLVVAASVLLMIPWIANAQDATLSGVVTDTTDAVLPGAIVTAIHVDTGTTFVAVSGANGSYRTTLRVGVYKITAELSGFATVTRENVQVLVGQNLVLNLKMGLSTVQESVTVSGQAPLVDTTA